MGIYIIGIGPGSEEYVLPKAVDIMKKSDVILGFHRAIDSLHFLCGKKIIVRRLSEIIDYINEYKDKTVSIAASGDPLFYGITNYIKNNYDGEIHVIPGISSFQYMMAKLCMSWQGSFLGSLHGREDEFLEAVEKNKISIWLTDARHSPGYIIDKLNRGNINAKMCIGENLSYEDEKITEVYIKGLNSISCSDLCVVVIENLDLD